VWCPGKYQYFRGLQAVEEQHLLGQLGLKGPKRILGSTRWSVEKKVSDFYLEI
jgi:hypothetical protein